jgi:thiol-disulfide isomerase/thioredoxin
MDAVYYVLGALIVMLIVIMAYRKLFVKPEDMKPVREYVLHYTDWCPACKIMHPIWDKVTAEFPYQTFRKHNETENPDPAILGYPMIIRHYEDGTKELYPGGNSEDRLRAFLVGAPMPVPP